MIDDFDASVGLERLRCLHVNDSRVPLGANRDMHANVGEGEMGAEGIATFLSEPRFEKLPALLETPGPDKKGADAAEVGRARELREQGRAARCARPTGSGGAALVEHVAQVEAGVGLVEVEERGVDAGMRGAVALERGLDPELALRQRLTDHLDPAVATAALGGLEELHVDLAPEDLLHAAHEAPAGRPVDVAPQVRAAHLQTVARLDQLVAVGAAATALARWCGQLSSCCDCHPGQCRHPDRCADPPAPTVGGPSRAMI